MAHLDTVAGIELNAINRSRAGFAKYLRCDSCRLVFEPTPKDVSDEDLRQQARAAGWTGDMTRASDHDRCPKCAALP